MAKFDADAGAWWDAAGPAAPLHALNPVRADFVKRVVCDAHGSEKGRGGGRFVGGRGEPAVSALPPACPDLPQHPEPQLSSLDHTALEPLTGLSIVDVGCGGGLLSEALARLGAAVTGVDASAGGVAAARAHAAGDPRIAARVSYSVSTAEELVAAGRSFDAVVASEVIEHVPAPGPFVHALASLLAPASRGPVVVSTLSRTPRAYATAILGAEVLARVVPHGTHDWHRFLTPGASVRGRDGGGLRPGLRVPTQVGTRAPHHASHPPLGASPFLEDLALLGDDAGLALDIACGMTPVPTRAGLRWRLTGDLGVNYIVSLVRTGGGE